MQGESEPVQDSQCLGSVALYDHLLGTQLFQAGTFIDREWETAQSCKISNQPWTGTFVVGQLNIGPVRNLTCQCRTILFRSQGCQNILTAKFNLHVLTQFRETGKRKHTWSNCPKKRPVGSPTGMIAVKVIEILKASL